LHRAVWNGQAEAVKLLVDTGVDISIKNNDDLVPLALARHNEVALFLYEAQRKMSANNAEGETEPLELNLSSGDSSEADSSDSEGETAAVGEDKEEAEED